MHILIQLVWQWGAGGEWVGYLGLYISNELLGDAMDAAGPWATL